MDKSFSIKCIFFCSLLCSQLIYAALQDPTRPPNNIQGEAIVSPALFVLNEVVIGRDRRIAVINGLNKKVGDEILGERITAIHENTVQLEGSGGKITLFLFDNNIKQLSPSHM